MHPTKAIFLRVLKNQYLQTRFISDVQRKIKNSYYFMHGDVLLSSSTLGQILDEAADKSGDRIAFISAHQGISRNFSEFRHEVNRVASGLISCGLKRGDRIGICSPNCYEWPVIQFAAAKAGLIMANINPASQPGEIEYYLKKVECKAIVTWNTSKNRSFYDILCEVIPEIPKTEFGQIQSSKFPSLKSVIMISDERHKGIITYKDVIDMRNKESDETLFALEKSLQFDDPVNIQFTSGTTGLPKGAVLSHHNIINNALVSGRRLGYNLLKSTVCCQVPLFHCFGCVVGTLETVMFQNTCVFPSTLFNASESLKAIKDYKCSTVYGTPTMYVDLLKIHQSEEFKVPSLKQAVIGGAPPPAALVRDVKNNLNVHFIHIAYGSTENSPVVTLSGINDDFENVEKGILQPLEYVEVKVVDNSNRLLPINTEGEVCVRGHGLFLGYWKDEEKTKEVVDKNNWYYTGDLGLMNEYGFIQIVGRKKDIILRGGENLYPLEIENFLNTHSAILEVHVVGVPDERMGEEVCAWILLKPGVTVTEQEIKDFCNGKISHFKIPRYMEFVHEFPKTTSGKIKKFEMAKISKQKLNL